MAHPRVIMAVIIRRRIINANKGKTGNRLGIWHRRRAYRLMLAARLAEASRESEIRMRCARRGLLAKALGQTRMGVGSASSERSRSDSISMSLWKEGKVSASASIHRLRHHRQPGCACGCDVVLTKDELAARKVSFIKSMLQKGNWSMTESDSRPKVPHNGFATQKPICVQ